MAYSNDIMPFYLFFTLCGQVKICAFVFMAIAFRDSASDVFPLLPLKEVIAFCLCLNLLNYFAQSVVAGLLLLIDCHLVFQASD